MPAMDFSDPTEFAARSYEWRLWCGSEAIENRLKEEVLRQGARRAFLICSPSIKNKTNGVERVQAALGPLLAGSFHGIRVEAPYPDVLAATQAAREAGADLLLALGAGTVIVATRVIDIFLCEQRDHFELMTQYPEGKPAVSPRLFAPKLPIINIPTTPTGAMNRAGSGIANPELDQNRMEYFDPKTRPVALIWDHEAIMATPYEMMRGFATNAFLGAALDAGRRADNPLAEADREHIRTLARRGYHRLVQDPDSIAARIDLYVAALLANRAADDSRRGVHVHEGETFDGDLALATALHVRYPHVWQQDSGSALRATVIRRSRSPAPEALEAIARAMGIWEPGRGSRETQLAIADEVERVYRREGMPTRVRELNVPREDFPAIAKASVKVFNSNAGLRDEARHLREATALLEAAW
ncbi:MAG: iron-containing alcohol dehydrogenase [Chloroflexi bacterium]|nr:iron-containing alcohol dehydrogenase [Chloroflexota bacterium]